MSKDLIEQLLDSGMSLEEITAKVKAAEKRRSANDKYKNDLANAMCAYAKSIGVDLSVETCTEMAEGFMEAVKQAKQFEHFLSKLDEKSTKEKRKSQGAAGMTDEEADTILRNITEFFA